MRRAGWVAAALVALLAAWAPATHAQQADPETLRLLLARAETLLRAGNAEAGLDALDRLFARAENIDSGSPVSLRLVLRRALETSAVARWESGQREALDDDLDRLIQLDPAYEFAAGASDEGLLARFTRRRERLVGFLRVGLSPADAEVVLNGVALEDPGEIIPVLAGDHVVGARRRGFAPQQETVSVRANRTEGVGLTLERSSATVQVATSPPGAYVVLDGEAVGVTVGDDGADTSAPLLVEGLLPGWHELEITLTNHRPFFQRFEVPNLGDYDLGTLTMGLAVGNVTLRDVPTSAEFWIDGASTSTSRGGDGSVRLQLPVGDHDILVGAAGGRVWSGTASVVDGGTATRDVQLAPGLAFLGIAGGDALDRDAANGPVLRALRQLTGWSVLDRSTFAADLLPAEASALASGSQNELRCRFEDETPAGVFVIGAFDDEDRSVVELTVWASGSTLPPAHLTTSPGDPESLRAALAPLAAALPSSRVWHGLVVFDTPQGPVVGTADADSPGGRAGFVPGDRLVSLAGGGVTSAQAFVDWLEAAGPQRGVDIVVERSAATQSLRLEPESSPQIAAAPDPATAISWWGRAAAGIAAADAAQPVWALHLQQALLLIESTRIDAAVDMLWDAAAPAGSPFGQAAVDYWLGVALTLADEPDLDAARNAFNRAASVSDARLFHNDGPRIAPRARARIRRIAAATDR
jgi:hypothetical protein